PLPCLGTHARTAAARRLVAGLEGVSAARAALRCAARTALHAAVGGAARPRLPPRRAGPRILGERNSSRARRDRNRACAGVFRRRARLPSPYRRKIHRTIEITIDTMMLVVSGK